MSRQSRIKKAEEHLRTLEETFSAELRQALAVAAGGRWGMFGAYLDLPYATLNDDYNELHTLGKQIDSLRTELGMPSFDLYARYEHYCRQRGSNDLGEARRAQRFLAELDMGVPAEE